MAQVRIRAGQGAQLRQANDAQGDPFQDIELTVTALSEDVLVSQLCSAGSGVVVLEPESIRTRVREALQRIVTMHGEEGR